MDIILASMLPQLDEGEGEDYIEGCREGIRNNSLNETWQNWLCISLYRNPAISVIETNIIELNITNCPHLQMFLIHVVQCNSHSGGC